MYTRLALIRFDAPGWLPAMQKHRPPAANKKERAKRIQNKKRKQSPKPGLAEPDKKPTQKELRERLTSSTQT